jgi:esterase/lipase
LLVHPSIREQKQLQQIVQDKLDVAENLKKYHKKESNSSTADSDEVHNIDTANSFNKLQQITTMISHQANVDDVNTNTTNDG